MARLTNSDRERILRTMKPGIRSKAAKVEEDLSKVLNGIIKEEIPEEVFAFQRKYPKLVIMRDFLCVSVGKYSISIPIAKHPVNFFGDFWKTMKASTGGDEVKRLLDVLKEELEQAYVIEKKIACILDNISTEKRLKDEFPEAYAAYMSLDDGEVNSCDSIENVRAQLSALKKK